MTVETQLNNRRETHPYNLNEPIPPDAVRLIVGTAPPPRFSVPRSHGGSRREGDVDFYYGSEDNYLWWEFLDNIAREIDGENILPEELSAEGCCRAMRRFLQQHKIWMRDILQTYERRDGSANDNSIVNPCFIDLWTVFNAENAALSVVAFTSEQAAKWTHFALNKQNVLSGLETWTTLSREWRSVDGTARVLKPFATPKIIGRTFTFYILPSPSPRMNALNRYEKKKIYRSVLFPG